MAARRTSTSRPGSTTTGLEPRPSCDQRVGVCVMGDESGQGAGTSLGFYSSLCASNVSPLTSEAGSPRGTRRGGGIELGAGASATGRGSLQKGEEEEPSDDRVLDPAGARGPTLGEKSQRSERQRHDPTFRGDGPKAPSHPAGTKPGLASDYRSRSHRGIIAPTPTGDRILPTGKVLSWKATAPLDRITYCP
jgi:hypothetical protein